MLKHIRNTSFLVFMAVSMFVATVKADISCEEAEYNCEELWIGMACPWGWPVCSGGQWTMQYTCEERDEVCGDGEVYWQGTCEIGSAC